MTPVPRRPSAAELGSDAVRPSGLLLSEGRAGNDEPEFRSDSAAQTLPTGARRAGWRGERGLFVRLLGRITHSDNPDFHPRSAIDDVVECVRREGPSALRLFHGPFAAIVVDQRAGAARISLYREPLGRERLSYACAGMGRSPGGSAPTLFVGRLAHPLTSLASVGRRIDTAWCRLHFSLARPRDQRTPFDGVHKVLPGELVTWHRGRLERERVPPGPTSHAEPLPSDRVCIDTFAALLTQAVERALPDDDSPLGIMLSGGMDSAPLAAVAQARYGDRGGVRAVSWSLPGFPGADEAQAIRAVADHVGCAFELVRVDDRSAVGGALDEDIGFEQPVLNAFRPLKSAVYRAAQRAGCRVLFNGTGGDNLYPNSRYALLDGLRGGRWRLVAEELLYRLRASGLAELHRDPALRWLGRSLLRRPEKPTAAPVWVSRSLATAWSELPPPWPAESIEHARPEHYRACYDQLACDGGADENDHAAAFGLEIRDPYRDPDLIAFMLSLPAHLSWRAGQSKWVAREAMRGHLPPVVRTSPRTGLLGEFFAAGYRETMPRLRALLKRESACWDEFVDRSWLDDALSASAPTELQMMIVWYCASFECWRAQVGLAPPATDEFDRRGATAHRHHSASERFEEKAPCHAHSLPR